jgi:hypothetical protein
VGKRPTKGSTRHQSLSRDARRRAAVAMRHERARRTAKLHRTRRKRRIVAVSVLAALVLVAGLGYFFIGSGGSSTTNYTLTAPLAPATDPPVTISNVPTSYQLVYRVQSFGDSPATNTEVITVKRPFDSKLEQKTGEPPGNDVQQSLVWTLGKYAQTSSGGSPSVDGSAPQAALGDMRFDATLQNLVADGSFATREKRTVLGRECQVYRTGQALETFTVSAATKLDYTDACIDASGLLLEEVSVSSGKLAERLIATAVDDTTAQPDATFAVTGDPTSLAAGGTSLTPADPANPPVAGYWHMDAPPAGYQFQGRYLLQTPSDSSASSDPTATTTTTTAPSPPVSSYVDVYVNGPNTITVRQGPAAGEPTPDTTGDTGTTVDLGPLGSANLTTSLSGSRLVAHPSAPTGWYVEVMGTVPRSTLQDVAKSLHS